LDTRVVTTWVAAVFAAAGSVRPELDDAVMLDPVERDPVLVAEIDPPPQPASPSTIAAAAHARGEGISFAVGLEQQGQRGTCVGGPTGMLDELGRQFALDDRVAPFVEPDGFG